jgi:large subunit ribosomal protein L3
MIGLLGKKLGQTRVYDEQGNVTCVTVVLAGPNHVLQVKTKDGADGYNAVQLGFGEQKEQRVTKPLLGHIKKFSGTPVKWISEFRDFGLPVKPGDVVTVNIFEKGDWVDAIGVVKGRGFEGVVKRHRFAGGDSTHGAKGWHRRSGAIGNRLFPGTVLRGMKMPGHMGQVQRTTQNLEVMQVREADHLLLIKGSIPGSKGDYVVIREAKKRSKGTKFVKGPMQTPKKGKSGAAPAAKK